MKLIFRQLGHVHRSMKMHAVFAISTILRLNNDYNLYRKLFKLEKRLNTRLGNAVERLFQHQIKFNQMISVGAGSGGDSLYLSRQFGSIPVLMIEAQSEHETELAELKRKYPWVDYYLCAATNFDGQVSFAAPSLTGGAIVAEGPGARRVPARRIDSLVEELRLSGPFFLKFDTHGAELEIIQGAIETLAHTSLIMMEVYNFKLDHTQPKNLTFWEMIPYLQERGFRCVDFCDPLFRPGDGVLWQMQMFFIRANHPVFESNSYLGKIEEERIQTGSEPNTGSGSILR